MKIQVECEPFMLDDRKIRISFRVRHDGKDFAIDKLLEDDWLEDKSIFKRVIEQASYILQNTMMADRGHGKMLNPKDF